MYKTSDLPRRTVGLPAALKPILGTRKIESAFVITDDYLRTAKDDVLGGQFRPDRAEVVIDLDRCDYHVALTGPFYSSAKAPANCTGRQVLVGDHFLDSDEHNGLVVDLVNATLTAHGHVEAGA